MTLNVERSRKLAAQVRAKRGSCYRDAFAALAYCGNAAKYVEGYVVDPEFPIPVAHGWIELEDGQRIDPTATTWLRPHGDGVELMTDDQLTAVVHVPGFRFSMIELLRLVSTDDDARSLPIWDRYEFTPEYYPMMIAHDVAFAVAGGDQMMRQLRLNGGVDREGYDTAVDRLRADLAEQGVTI